MGISQEGNLWGLYQGKHNSPYHYVDDWEKTRIRGKVGRQSRFQSSFMDWLLSIVNGNGNWNLKSGNSASTQQRNLWRRLKWHHRGMVSPLDTCGISIERS
jgi:hypothetical protein